MFYSKIGVVQQLLRLYETYLKIMDIFEKLKKCQKVFNFLGILIINEKVKSGTLPYHNSNIPIIIFNIINVFLAKIPNFVYL